MVQDVQEQETVPVQIQARHFRMPWEWIILAAVVLMAVGVLAYADTQRNPAVRVIREQSYAAPAVSEASVSEPQTVLAPEVKERPKVELKWVEIVTVRAGEKVPQIPSEKFTFMPGATAVSELGYHTANSHGYGDGTAFVMANSPGWWEKENVEVSFTPDKGATWFTAANPYPGRSSTPTDVVGALLEGDTLVLYIALQSQPWVYTYWRADTPLATIEGLSP